MTIDDSAVNCADGKFGNSERCAQERPEVTRCSISIRLLDCVRAHIADYSGVRNPSNVKLQTTMPKAG
jgi:hypothetical protein